MARQPYGADFVPLQEPSDSGRNGKGHRRFRGRPREPLAQSAVPGHTESFEILGQTQAAERLEQVAPFVGRGELVIKVIDVHWRSSPLGRGIPLPSLVDV